MHYLVMKSHTNMYTVFYDIFYCLCFTAYLSLPWLGHEVASAALRRNALICITRQKVTSSIKLTCDIEKGCAGIIYLAGGHYLTINSSTAANNMLFFM